MTSDLVSVVMPVHNAAPYLAVAVESVRAQRWPRIELVAVDDGSTDASREILARMQAEWRGPGRRMRVLSQSNRGAGAARDAGIAVSGGAFVALLDADDIYAPDLVGACTERLLEDPSADMAFTPARIVDAGGRLLSVAPLLPDRLDAVDLLDGKFLNHPVVRRSAVEAVGGHDAALRAGIDLDIFVRIALRRPDCIVTLPRHLSDYRVHGGQITRDWRAVMRGWEHSRDTVRQARPDLPAARVRAAHARKCLYWAELAYAAGDYAAARRLMAIACLRLPRETLAQRQARIRLASCLVSLLPGPLHDHIRRRFNAARQARSDA